MKSIILGGLAAGAITVLICTSHLGEKVRQWSERLHPYLGQLFNCCFCTSWWVSIAMLDKFTLVEWAATVAIANFTVLLIHLGIATVGENEDVQLDQELVRPAKLQQCVAEGHGGEVSRGDDQFSGVRSVRTGCEQPRSYAACEEPVTN